MDRILVTRSSMPPLDEYIAEIAPMWESHWLTNMGAKHQALEAALRDYLGVEHIELVVNGHMALELTLQALGLTGEVITTPFTFASTTHAIVRAGLTPVFGDIRAEDYTLDPASIERLVTERTSAILPVHVYGGACDVRAIERIAGKYNLKVIYDAAHTFGARYAGRALADYGDAACLSFHATKVFHTIEGGAVVYHDAAVGERLYNLKNFGIRGENVVDAIGANAKMNEFAAAMGLCNLRHIDGEIARRGQVVARYNARLVGIPGLRLPPAQAGLTPNYAYYPVVVEGEHTAGEVLAALATADVMARRYFYPLTSDFDCYAGRYSAAVPVAREVAERVLTLPLYADLPLTDVDRIAGIVRAVLTK